MGLIPYIGGDTNIARYIVSLLPRGKVFAELFGGGAAVTMEVAKRRMYEKIILNEKDFYVYAAYYVMKHHLEIFSVIHDFMVFYYTNFYNDVNERSKFKEVFRQVRDEMVRGEIRDVVEAGFWSIILHMVAIAPFASGLPLRRAERPSMNVRCRDYLYERHLILQHVTILNTDAIDLISELDHNDVVMYLDPPHVELPYYRINFSYRDAVRLAQALRDVKHARVLLKLTKGDLRYYEPYLDSWAKFIKEYKVQTQGCKTKTKKISEYIFLSNYEIQKKLWSSAKEGG